MCQWKSICTGDWMMIIALPMMTRSVVGTASAAAAVLCSPLFDLICSVLFCSPAAAEAVSGATRSRLLVLHSFACCLLPALLWLRVTQSFSFQSVVCSVQQKIFASAAVDLNSNQRN